MDLKDIPTMFVSVARRLFTAPPMAKKANLNGKKIIVTGAGVGSIGYQTAKRLAAWGATVIITTRSKPEVVAQAIEAELKTESVSAKLDAFPLDLTNVESVAEFAAWYLKKHGDRLDVLVNNAGVHLDILSKWKEPQLTTDGVEVHWRTNYLGPMQLTHLLLPLLKKTGKMSGDARVVNVSSHLHTRGLNSELFKRTRPYNSWDAYGNSKLALVHSAFEIQRRFANEFNLKGLVLHPGSISTNIAHKGLEGSKFLQKMRDLFASVEALILMTPEQGAQTQIYCASSPDVRGGIYYDRCAPGVVSAQADDLNVATHLWQETERWITSLSPKNVATVA